MDNRTRTTDRRALKRLRKLQKGAQKDHEQAMTESAESSWFAARSTAREEIAHKIETVLYNEQLDRGENEQLDGEDAVNRPRFRQRCTRKVRDERAFLNELFASYEAGPELS